MSDHHSNSEFENDRAHLLHPFTEFPRALTQGSRFFERGEGVYVYGADGKRYLDGMGGLWCVNIGYGRKEMADAIAEQALRLPYYNTFGDMSSGPAADLAARLADLAPGDLNHVFFSTGGSTAVDSALRLAHYFFQAEGRPEKRKIIAREMGYHGSTFLGASITGIRRNHARFHTLATGPDPLVHYVSNPGVYRRPDGLDEAAFCDALMDELEAAIATIGADNIACFFAEPVMGAGGVLVAPSGYHRRALDICRRHDILYVSDEVITAFGRLGHMFSSEDKYAIVPDIIAIAKGVTSGYVPLGATIFSDRIHHGISQAKTGPGNFSHGFTYSGHPVACAAGLKNIEIMEREDLCGHVRRVTPHFRRAVEALREFEIVGDVRGEGFMMAVEFVADRATKKSFDPALTVGRRVHLAAYERGLTVRYSADSVFISPPLVLDEGQASSLADTLREAIAAVAAELTV
jgi:putrescine aminotransferase